MSLSRSATWSGAVEHSHRMAGGWRQSDEKLRSFGCSCACVEGAKVAFFFARCVCRGKKIQRFAPPQFAGHPSGARSLWHLPTRSWPQAVGENGIGERSQDCGSWKICFFLNDEVFAWITINNMIQIWALKPDMRFVHWMSCVSVRARGLYLTVKTFNSFSTYKADLVLPQLLLSARPR